MKSKNRKPKRKNSPPPVADNPPAETSITSPPSYLVWASWKRLVASVFILAYLFLLIIGPLSNPVGSKHLSVPIAETVAPIHRGLFMGHGYRFFAPNPGDSHLVQYKITKSDGTQVEGTIPDRDTVWPRLLYHRWFMLSETIFSEHARTPSPNEFKKLNDEKQRRAKLLSKAGKFQLAQKLESERAEEKIAYDKTINRIKTLVRSTGKFLLDRHQGEEIELLVATRTIPFPAEVRQGADLGDEVFLRYPANAVIGRFTKSELTENGDTTETVE